MYIEPSKLICVRTVAVEKVLETVASCLKMKTTVCISNKVCSVHLNLFITFFYLVHSKDKIMSFVRSRQLKQQLNYYLISLIKIQLIIICCCFVSYKALNILPNDSKALFRRCQGQEKLGRLESAFRDARTLIHIEPKVHVSADQKKNTRLYMYNVCFKPGGILGALLVN